MKFLLSTLSAVALLAGVGVANAMEVSGTISKIDTAENRIELNNGGAYALPGEWGSTELNVGDKVKLQWWSRTQDGYRMARDVEILSREKAMDDSATPLMTAPGEAIGYVKAKNNTDNQITLGNGYVIELDANPGASDLNVGDKVRVSWNGFGRNGIARVADIAVLESSPQTSKTSTMTMKAPGETVGFVRQTDETKNQITLSNGYVFKLNSDPGAFDLDVGDKIHVSWNGFTHSGVLEAADVKILKHANM